MRKSKPTGVICLLTGCLFVGAAMGDADQYLRDNPFPYPFEFRIGLSSIHIKYRILVKDGKVIKVEECSGEEPENNEGLNPLSA